MTSARRTAMNSCNRNRNVPASRCCSSHTRAATFRFATGPTLQHWPFAILSAALFLASQVSAGDFSLALPIDCKLGATCHIQQFMDRDPGPGVRDFTCGDLSYDGHKGTDFALPTLAHMARGVDVLAAAPGRVRAARDGMPDQKFGAANADDVAGRECGNGVVLLHPGGFETQYCHLKSGSIAVRPGDEIRRGDVLGQVGLSGKTQFPHLHLSVRRDGVEIDPFDPAMSDACGGGGPGLWSSPAPSYRAGGLSDAGFTDALPAYDDVLAGTAARGALPQNAPAMVLFGLAYGGRMGDTLRFDLTGPGGTVLNQELQLDKDQAQFFRAVGKRRRDAAWQAGRYLGVIEFRRGNTLLDRHTVEIRVR